MAGDEDVVEGHETGEIIVDDSFGGVILVEDGALLLVDIDGESAEFLTLERFNDCGGVNLILKC